MTHLELLRAAVAAKIAYWDAMDELERGLGHPDRDDDVIHDYVESLAAGVNDADDIGEGQVVDLLGELE